MKTFAMVCLLAVLTGCAYLPSFNRSTTDQVEEQKPLDLVSDARRSRLIAADFVAALAQIPTTNPASTILHTAAPTTRFGELLLSELQAAGFDLRIGTASSEFWLAYTAMREQQASDTDPLIYTFIVAAGEVKLKRSYEVDESGVRPAGNMLVKGADSSNIVMDESIFTIQQLKPAQEPAPTLADLNNADVQINAVPTPEPFVKTSKLSAPSKQSGVKTESDESVAMLSTSNSNVPVADYKEFSNMYNTAESRYKAIFDEYDVVDSQVLVFPNDSLVLGYENKRSVWAYADTFNPETDLVSVIGCSHGATNIENGNGYLANGRAFRVKEEFVAAGFEPQKVLEEGCWANVAFAKMPARGVLVQLKRRIN